MVDDGSATAPVSKKPDGRPTADDRFETPRYRAALADVLGVLTYAELEAFERIAADATMAPTVEDRAMVGGMAVTEYRHYVELRDYLVSLDMDPFAVMEPFVGAIDRFHALTTPADWLEGLIKVYVGDGIAWDFYRVVAELLDEESKQFVLRAGQRERSAELIVRTVRDATRADPKVAGRLALWGRRLVGEALSQAQSVVGERDTLEVLLLGAGDVFDGLDGVTEVFEEITAAHSARMRALGLEA